MSEGDLLRVEFDQEKIVKIIHDHDKKEEVNQRIKTKMAKLKQRSGSKFKK